MAQTRRSGPHRLEAAPTDTEPTENGTANCDGGEDVGVDWDQLAMGVKEREAAGRGMCWEAREMHARACR